MDYIAANEFALQKLSRGQYQEAQAIFRLNKYVMPCATTLNNLGYFYCTEGLITKNGKHRRADMIGLRYMKEAAQEDPRPQILFNIGAVLYQGACYVNGNFAEAYQYFKSAIDSAHKDLCVYNMGVCAFRMKDWVDACNLFGQVLGHDSQIVDAGGTVPIVPYAYVSYKLQRTKDLNFTDFLTDDRIDKLDKFIIAYVYNKYELALDIGITMLKEWYASKPIIAMLANCILHKRPPEALELSVKKMCDECYPGLLSKLIKHPTDWPDWKYLQYNPPLAEIPGYLSF